MAQHGISPVALFRRGKGGLDELLDDVAYFEQDFEEVNEKALDRMDAKSYMERLRLECGVVPVDPEIQQRAELRKKRRGIVPGADYISHLPHSPWQSRSMLKRRVVLGTPAESLVVKNGVTRVHYPSGACYEGEVANGKRHGVGMITWPDGESYQGMWYMGMPHGLGVAEYGSGAAYCGEWYLGDRQGYGMYFYSDHKEEPHTEYVGQWKHDLLYGVGKRLSKNGTVYLGDFKKGLRHGEGISRVAHAGAFDPLGMAANALRKVRGTGRFGNLDAKLKAEVDESQIMGGISDWRAKEMGIVIQEGRFDIDDYIPRDKKEVRSKQAKLERKKMIEEMKARNEEVDEDELGAEEDENDANVKEREKKSKMRQARIRMMVKRDGVVLASKDFPEDPVDEVSFEEHVKTGMELSDAAELMAQKVRSKFHKVNFNFAISHFEKHERGYDHAVTDFNRENPYGTPKSK